MSEPFIAEVKIFAGNFAPRGYAFCNGQLLPVAQNTALFATIGTTYGGDGRTTTGLPNLQGRAPMHWGSGPGLTTRLIGEKVGAEKVGLAATQMPAHDHDLNAASNLTQADPSNTVSFGPVSMYATGGNSQDMASDALGSAGGTGAPHNNMQPFLAMNFIIALVGVFPTRS